ncbi:PQQ-like beta-propeller repeat protein [candidate division WOR-3 bacterium]|nr:PQQ-like beta-propeller repeat protein [candidate division WOR-3 bacterium]
MHQRRSGLGADGAIFAGSIDGYFYCLNPDGTLRWRYQLESTVESSPAIAPDSTIYFCANDGYLYALKGTQPIADSPWPKFHHDLKNTGRVDGP